MTVWSVSMMVMMMMETARVMLTVMVVIHAV